MTDLEALIEGISEKLYLKEPLSQAILHYLNKKDPDAHHIILDHFDQIVARDAKNIIEEVLGNEEAAKVTL
ncbi:MAG: hypothetical protein NC331_16740 [Lachnospiraceae bacterium]|nr:hypothetical protein [Lachnospiraceae bacterium]MCM1240998.1 hypothetical protein [Lachnospiraceae bacterium]